MGYEVKRISAAGIAEAIAKAELYRSLNEPEEAESICRDILAIEPQHQLALRLLGLALTDQASPLDPGLTSRPIAGVNWTADTAFVHHNRADHIALPFIERSLAQRWRDGKRKKHPEGVRPEQLKLLA